MLVIRLTLVVASAKRYVYVELSASYIWRNSSGAVGRRSAVTTQSDHAAKPAAPVYVRPLAAANSRTWSAVLPSFTPVYAAHTMPARRFDLHVMAVGRGNASNARSNAANVFTASKTVIVDG